VDNPAMQLFVVCCCNAVLALIGAFWNWRKWDEENIFCGWLKREKINGRIQASCLKRKRDFGWRTGIKLWICAEQVNRAWIVWAIQITPVGDFHWASVFFSTGLLYALSIWSVQQERAEGYEDKTLKQYSVDKRTE
jgi:hypothetical protein